MRGRPSRRHVVHDWALRASLRESVARQPPRTRLVLGLIIVAAAVAAGAALHFSGLLDPPPPLPPALDPFLPADDGLAGERAALDAYLATLPEPP